MEPVKLISIDCVLDYLDNVPALGHQHGGQHGGGCNITWFWSRVCNLSILETIRCLGGLAVKVVVKTISDQRPEFYPGTRHQYPFYEQRGTAVQRVGSGRFWGLTKYSEPENRSCPCQECRTAQNPKKTWAYVMIVTAAHVVYDKSEAEKTVCLVDYDDENSDVFHLCGHDVGEVCVEEDRSNLICVTHDADLVEKFEKTWSVFMELFKTLNRKYEDYSALENKLTVVVSHPHGGVKRVSIGQWVHRLTVKGQSNRFCYTACTCPGSSGAFVFILGMKGWWYHHVHSGTSLGFNYSGTGCGF
ncbi:uncharacterized protein LOC131942817 [Physella acuta]|uniref:uncharacterized protein LOC131942817 n=1 Tax=Physella acuta TaxID=109671 RepID=UPI0027DD6F23|nr:uncharacterized protein LOC131942817 [Physella acuta]